MFHYAYRFSTIAALLISGLLGALSDSERLVTFDALVLESSKTIPQQYLRWLDSQTVAFVPSAITGDYKEIKEKLERISKHISKPSPNELGTLGQSGPLYHNVNRVITPLQEYIVGQAPLETTLSDFWHAILEAHVPTIVVLSMPTDAGGKSPPYWEIERFPLSVSGWTIERRKGDEVVDVSQSIPSQRIIRRTFLATHEESGETRTITHIHYENWPDNGAPEPLLFYRFIHLVSSIHPLSSSPLFVHCAAGIGRSGTFVTAHSLCKEIDLLHPTTINIPQRVVALRMQRSGLVSTVVQFAAIYEAIRNCAQQS